MTTIATQEASSIANDVASSAITVEKILPKVIWLEHVLPCLDRPAWNALMEASKEVYKLAMISKLSDDFHQRIGPGVAQPPWPTNQSLQSTLGGQDQAIESFTLSHDGEFLACGSAIGSIDIWNLRTGKLLWKKTHPLGNEEAEVRAQCPNYYNSSSTNAYESGTSSSMERRCSPIGSVLKFSPEGYTLACGFENRVFVWDLKKELKRRRKIRSIWHNMNFQTRNGSRPSSYAVPPQPQLRDDRNEESCYHRDDPQIHPHLCLIKSSPAHRVYANRRLDELEQKEEESFETLEIKCRQGTIYEVTYLEFSNDAHGSEKAGNRLIARYGKAAYIWTRQASANGGRYALTHTIVLTSSRCQIVSDPSLSCLAVATNGGGSTAGASRRRRNNGESQGTSDDTNITTADGKGIIHVWNLTRNPNEVPQFQSFQEEERTKVISYERDTTILAYRKHAVRGLEFLEVGSTGTRETCLVSASLQGEVKFWKRLGDANRCEREDAFPDKIDPESSSKFVCVYKFHSPGKIFSMASWSSVTSPGSGSSINEEDAKILLAAGEARGQVRVWKLRPQTLFSSSPVSSMEVSNECFGPRVENERQQSLEECLSTAVGDHVHYDNIKLLAFTPNGKSLAVSRAYDAKIWFQTVWQ